MITGFNTDVEFNGVIYHVQTEDKGLETPLLLTLVYDRGTILASKRQPYDDLFKDGFSEKELETRLKRQHSLVCAAIKAGRVGELIELTRRNSKNAHEKAKDRNIDRSKRDIAAADAERSVAENIATCTNSASTSTSDKSEPVVEVIGVIDDEIEVPTEAVEIISQMAGRERPPHDRLSIEFINETKLKGGENRTVTFLVCRGTERKVVGSAQILVKILGSNFRPQILHSVTDKNGLARMEVELPSFSDGRASFLVRASSAGDEIELRRTISST